MKILIVEDEFSSRIVMHKLLSPYGESHIAVNGKEAVEVFEQALLTTEPYNLVCLDIVMPEMDGLEVLKTMRRIEANHGIKGVDGAKIIMTTSVDNPQSVMKAFSAQCEAYLVKPIERASIVEHLRRFGLVNETGLVSLSGMVESAQVRAK